MKISVEEKKKEAVSRMKKLNIPLEIIRRFTENGLVSQSKSLVYGRVYSQIGGKQRKHIRAFEKEHNALVYHVLHDVTKIGELEVYLFVSDCSEEGKYDRELLGIE